MENRRLYQYMGTTLRTLRKKTGVTQKELAEKLGVTHTTVSAWEKGTNPIDVATLDEICRQFEVSPQLFFMEKNAENRAVDKFMFFVNQPTDISGQQVDFWAKVYERIICDEWDSFQEEMIISFIDMISSKKRRFDHLAEAPFKAWSKTYEEAYQQGMKDKDLEWKSKSKTI